MCAENTKCVAESVASNTKTTRQQHEIYCPNCGSVEIKKAVKPLQIGNVGHVRLMENVCRVANFCVAICC